MIIEDVIEAVTAGKSVEEAVTQLLGEKNEYITSGLLGSGGEDRSRLGRKPGPVLGPPTAPKAPTTIGKAPATLTGLRPSIFGKAAGIGRKLTDKFGGGQHR